VRISKNRSSTQLISVAAEIDEDQATLVAEEDRTPSAADPGDIALHEPEYQTLGEALNAVDPSGVFNEGWDHRHQASLKKAQGVLEAARRTADAYDVITSHPAFPKRGRAPNRNNIPLLAVQFVAKPREDAEFKLCSDWANLLIMSEQSGRPLGEVTLTEAKEWVRAQRRTLRQAARSNTGEAHRASRSTSPSSSELPSGEQGQAVCVMEIRLTFVGGVRESVSAALECTDLNAMAAGLPSTAILLVEELRGRLLISPGPVLPRRS
jgi:hypothetical protein